MRILLTVMLLMLFVDPIFSQKKNQDSFDKLLGTYIPVVDSLLKFNNKKENERLVVEIEGQGKTELSRISANRFKPKHVQPATVIEFVFDSAGNAYKFLWIQQVPKFEWTRISDSANNTSTKDENFNEYTGKYKLSSSAYQIITIKNENGHLTSQTSGESKHDLSFLSKDNFEFRLKEFLLNLEFVRDASGKVQKMITTRKGPIVCIKTSNINNDLSFAKHVFGSNNGFTAADTLRGMLTPVRTCYDVLFYNLDVTIDPETKSIKGNNIIRLKAIQSFDKIQVDLFANMKIEKILFHGQQLSYTRKFDAVFIQFPSAINAGNIEELNIYYSGKPQLPDPSTSSGGFLWFQDKNGKPWIESVCQGSGASLWWPCKDHLSDKPDSMKINITIPRGMTEISKRETLK
jgi:hypothetical protein